MGDGAGSGVASWNRAGVFVGRTGETVEFATMPGVGIDVGTDVGSGVAVGLRLNNARIRRSWSTVTVI